MNLKKVGLLPKIIIAITLGIVAGMFMPTPLVRLFATFNGLFSQFLTFIIPLIIVGLVTPAIADIGKGAGKMLLATVALAYGATIFSGYYSYGISQALFPSLISGDSASTLANAQSGVEPFFTITIPEPMGVMTALVLAFTLGLGIISLKTDYLRNVCNDFGEVVSKAIQSAIIPLLPLYIFGIFLSMSYSGQVATVLLAFIKIIGIIFLMHVLLLVIQYGAAGLVARRNPFKLLKGMLPAYFTALGTQSSAATIPVTLAQTVKNGVSEGVAGFVIPLCATIHLSGSTMKIVSCALALMLMTGAAYDFSTMSGFIFMLGVTMVAAPGVPGGAIMASLGVLSSTLGFDDNMQALMIALYIAMDSFGTACNVTGDGALAVMIDHWFGGKTGTKTNGQA